jgi:hypothetical protein
LIWGLFVFLDGLAVMLLDLQYDSGGIEGLATILFELLGLPVFLAARLLGELGMVAQDPLTIYAALAVGLVICIVTDWAIQRQLRRRRGEESGNHERPNAP